MARSKITVKRLTFAHSSASTCWRPATERKRWGRTRQSTRRSGRWRWSPPTAPRAGSTWKSTCICQTPPPLADDRLTGYTGGLARKRFLLDLERPGGPGSRLFW